MAISNPKKTQISVQDRLLIDAFLERAWSELGLADNTLSGYRRDLDAFARWLVEPEQASGLLDCRRALLFAYLASR
ncbi:MAG: site-specific integrase, partial [Dokdonella sp.]